MKWYIEVTWERVQQAREALNDAIERYRQYFWAAVQEQPALKKALRDSGLPLPV
jgi:hypothetical protein